MGIGGLSKDAIVYEAKTNLMHNRPLKKGEYYANVTVDFKRTAILFYASNEVFLHADVLTAHPDTTQATTEPVTENNNALISYVNTKQDSFYLGENIVYRLADDGGVFAYKTFKIESFTYKDKAVLKALSGKEKNIVIDVDMLIYAKDRERKGFKSGDVVSAKPKGIRSGKIMATSANYALVNDGFNTIEVKYEELTKIDPAK